MYVFELTLKKNRFRTKSPINLSLHIDSRGVLLRLKMIKCEKLACNNRTTGYKKQGETKCLKHACVCVLEREV